MYSDDNNLVSYNKCYITSLKIFDIKKVEEQVTQMETNLIFKKLETLDVLKKLGATERIVEDFTLIRNRVLLKHVKCFICTSVNK